MILVYGYIAQGSKFTFVWLCCRIRIVTILFLLMNCSIEICKWFIGYIIPRNYRFMTHESWAEVLFGYFVCAWMNFDRITIFHHPFTTNICAYNVHRLPIAFALNKVKHWEKLVWIGTDRIRSDQIGCYKHPVCVLCPIKFEFLPNLLNCQHKFSCNADTKS